MNLECELILSFITWTFVKFLQLVYQAVYIIWLADENHDGRTTHYISVGSVILVLTISSIFFAYRSKEKLFAQYRNYSHYFELIKVDSLIFIIALIGYPIVAAYYKYLEKDRSERRLTYTNHSNDSLELEEKELNGNAEDLLNETICEDQVIKDASTILVDEALKIRSSLFPLANIEQKRSQFEDIPENENNGEIIQALLQEPSEPVNYLSLLTGLSFVVHFAVILAWMWVEWAKYRIKKAASQPNIEMGVINGAADNNQ